MRPSPGSLVPLRQVQDLVFTAIKFESNRAHEDQWNEDVHSTIIKMALAASSHAQSLTINSLLVLADPFLNWWLC